MVCDDHIWRGHALCIALVMAALAIVLLAGGVEALSNGGGGNWAYSRDIAISNPGAESFTSIGIIGRYFFLKGI